MAEPDTGLMTEVGSPSRRAWQLRRRRRGHLVATDTTITHEPAPAEEQPVKEQPVKVLADSAYGSGDLSPR